MGLPKMRYVVVVLILTCLGSQVESDASNHQFSKGDIVPFFANIIAPFYNSRETYAYYDLPYCSPGNSFLKYICLSLVFFVKVALMAYWIKDTVEEENLNLGEMLNGDRLVSTPYKFEFLVDKDFEVLCNKTLRKSDVSKFRYALDKDYYMQLYLDGLPIWAFIGRVQKNYTNEAIDDSISILHTHFEFEVLYNNDHVIEVYLRAGRHSVAYMTEDKEVNVNFTYSVRWKKTDKPFDNRMEKYIGSSILPHHLSVHHHSITLSSVALLILTIIIVSGEA